LNSGDENNKIEPEGNIEFPDTSTKKMNAPNFDPTPGDEDAQAVLKKRIDEMKKEKDSFLD
jgi:hypothetical protein